MKELEFDREKTFTFAETRFLAMWFEKQSKATQDQVRGWVQEGRVEVTEGFWAQNDELLPHYWDLVNNAHIGNQWVAKNLGVTPRVGWQLDAFGHTLTNAQVMAEAGFDAWFTGRFSFGDQVTRQLEHSFQYMWRPKYSAQGDRNDIVSHYFNYHYCMPHDFRIDSQYYLDTPIQDDPKLDNYNVDAKMDIFRKYLEDEVMPKYPTSDHFLVQMGCDFSFSNAQMTFANIDKLIKHFNHKYENEYEIHYSTPSDYIA